jgi:CDP-diacylglycerol--glycerol-3-phosphate 3-phosphatidyltransferase/cardiolipin synthase
MICFMGKMSNTMFNIPTILTLGRIVLIPVFVVFFYLPAPWANIAATAIFGVAAITDWADGYLARKWDQISPFGAFLDPVADKLMVAAALVLLISHDPSPWLAIPAVIIIGREITVSALREWMAELGERAKVAVSTLGKYKTTAQMIALLLLLYRDPLLGLPTSTLGMIMLYTAALLTLWSMIIYLRAAWPLMVSEEIKQNEES